MSEIMEEEKSLVINSIIGSGTFYNGEIQSVDLLRIDGVFSGVARSQDVILIGENGKVKGTLIAPRIIIAGVFQGKVADCQLVILQSTSVIIGGLQVKDIIVESGAIISGKLSTSKTLKMLADSPDSDSNTKDKNSSEENYVLTRNVGKYSTKMLERLFDS